MGGWEGNGLTDGSLSPSHPPPCDVHGWLHASAVWYGRSGLGIGCFPEYSQKYGCACIHMYIHTYIHTTLVCTRLPRCVLKHD